MQKAFSSSHSSAPAICTSYCHSQWGELTQSLWAVTPNVASLVIGHFGGLKHVVDS